MACRIGVSKKTEKLSKPRKKKPIIVFQKNFGSVRFWFPKPETGKTPTEPNRFDLKGTINRGKNHFLEPN